MTPETPDTSLVRLSARSDSGGAEAYTPRVDQESTPNPQPPPEAISGRFRRRPPTSKAERDRRRAWGLKWGDVGREYAQQLRAKEGR